MTVVMTAGTIGVIVNGTVPTPEAGPDHGHVPGLAVDPRHRRVGQC